MTGANNIKTCPTTHSTACNDSFILADRKFNSRLLVGTGRYKDHLTAKNAIKASGAEIVTVAVRRAQLNKDKNSGQVIQDYIDPEKYLYLPNSAGCYNAEDAVRVLRLGRNITGHNIVKLEVIEKNNNQLLPNMQETVNAAKMLAKEGFAVMVYCNDNLDYAKKLEDIGCVAIMPLAAPIGSGLGIINPDNIATIAQKCSIPVIVDAGIGTASDAVIAMELGCDGVLMNTAIARAENPVLMATAMKNAVLAGRMAYLAGRMPKSHKAHASSPTTGKIT